MKYLKYLAVFLALFTSFGIARASTDNFHFEDWVFVRDFDGVECDQVLDRIQAILEKMNIQVNSRSCVIKQNKFAINNTATIKISGDAPAGFDGSEFSLKAGIDPIRIDENAYKYVFSVIFMKKNMQLDKFIYQTLAEKPMVRR